MKILYDARCESEGRGHTWASRTENGVRYTWDVTRSMFSAGNVTEKIRIAKMDCTGEVVVDMVSKKMFFLVFLLEQASMY